jgi:hypothetical protein
MSSEQLLPAAPSPPIKTNGTRRSQSNGLKPMVVVPSNHHHITDRQTHRQIKEGIVFVPDKQQTHTHTTLDKVSIIVPPI